MELYRKSWVFRACELDQGRCPLDPCKLLKKFDHNFYTGGSSVFYLYHVIMLHINFIIAISRRIMYNYYEYTKITAYMSTEDFI